VKLSKYSALGNTYLVASPDEYRALPGEQITQLCGQDYGIGADGLLQLRRSPTSDVYQLRIWNPDGSEAERSGNGIRIAAAYISENRLVRESRFQLSTAAGLVDCSVPTDSRDIAVRLGQAIFEARNVPVDCEMHEVIDYPVDVAGESLRLNAVSVGNPHCVIFTDQPSQSLAKRLGPKIENHPMFPHRTNVQFVQVLDRHNLRVEIWERGAGYTLSSGTSSCAATAVSRRRNFVDNEVDVHMPGGVLHVSIDNDYTVTLTGPVTKIADITIDPALLVSAM
jgi:diaminopimelate epimerase